MEEIQLEVQVRDKIGSRRVKSLVKEDAIPGIVYGGESKTPTPIKVNRRSYEKIMRLHRGHNVLFHLNVMEGAKKLRDYSVIVKEEQLDPVSSQLMHLDFQRISLTKEIEVQVRIHTKGDPIGVKDGGSLEHTMWELDVICLPRDIPDHLEVEVGHLKISDAVHVRDIKLPARVRTKHDIDSVVASVAAPMKEEVVTPVEGAPTEPELIRPEKGYAFSFEFVSILLLSALVGAIVVARKEKA